MDNIIEAVLSTALDPAVAMDEAGRITAWNQIAEEAFGWSFSEVNGRLLSKVIIPPELRSRHDLGIKRYLRTGEARALGKHMEVVALHRSGRRFAAELSTAEIKRGSNRVFVGFIRDISARRDAETKLQEATERLGLAVKAHSIGIFDTNVETGRVDWNEELEAIYGYSPGTFDTSLDAWRRHVFPKDLLRIDKQFKRAIEARALELAYSYRMTRCDGAIRHIDASARFFYDQFGRNVRRVGVNIDVTDRKEAELRLSETQAELIHVSRLSSLGAMASSLSHELHQPLTAVANYIAAANRLLKGSAKERKAAIEAMAMASTASMRAGELIKRLRIMSNKKQPTREAISFSDLANDTAALALHDAKLTGIEFELYVDDEADAVSFDPVLLQQVLFNLLRNAAEAMEASRGSIVVRASVGSKDEVIVQVEDTGPGLDAKVAANLFTAFLSTKPNGMGVGLSICRTIIENNGGRIWAETSPRGTTFFFTAPRASGEVS